MGYGEYENVGYVEGDSGWRKTRIPLLIDDDNHHFSCPFHDGP
jgi:hypothetical protein